MVQEFDGKSVWRKQNDVKSRSKECVDELYKSDDGEVSETHGSFHIPSFFRTTISFKYLNMSYKRSAISISREPQSQVRFRCYRARSSRPYSAEGHRLYLDQSNYSYN